MDEAPKSGTIEHVESFLRYFAKFSAEESLFKPELECATQIVRVMRGASPTECPDAEIRQHVQRARSAGERLPGGVTQNPMTPHDTNLARRAMFRTTPEVWAWA